MRTRSTIASFLAFHLLIFQSIDHVSPLYFELNFTKSNHNGAATIQFQEDAFYNKAVRLTKEEIDGQIAHSVGRAVFTDPVTLWDSTTGQLADFTTRFTFMIKADVPDGSYGEGLAFFLSPYPSVVPSNSTDGNLGLFSSSADQSETSNQIVAIEFDSHQNPWDPDANHVGININSIISVTNVTWKSSIKDGKIANAWVTYQASSKNLSVFLTYQDNPQFSGNSSLSYPVDLRNYLPDKVAIGFSAATDHDRGSQTTVIAGTMGYLAPECVTTGKACKESDVYSFGILALEVACGRRPVVLKGDDDKINLVQWVWDLYGRNEILNAVDGRLDGALDELEAVCLMVVGLWCAHPDYYFRPSIRQVISVLKFEAPLPSLPPKMPVAMYFAPPIHLCRFSYTSSDGTLKELEGSNVSGKTTSSSSATNASSSPPSIHLPQMGY
nr:unnamed protein product [Digitaria exilis]